ncbi:MAG: hypothetical protein NC548_28825 [Lachnospiraceae bacterium]|nr:hypothetical protein [Lachnospiraceae bacterium]
MKPKEKKKGEIIANAIISREFDIPGYMYDLIDDCVVEAVFNRYNKDKCLKLFLSNPNFRTFCEYVMDIVNLRKGFFLEIIRTHKLWEGLFIFSHSSWAQFESYCFNVKITDDTIEELTGAPGSDEEFPFTEEEISDVLYMTIMNPELHDQFEYIFKFAYINVDELIEEFREKVPTRYLVNCLMYLDIWDNYKKSSRCIEKGIPVLYQHYDCTDLYLYLQTVIDTHYTGRLDPELDDIRKFVEQNREFLALDEILNMLWEIGTNLNQNNLKYYYLAAGKTEPDTKKLMMALENTDKRVIASWAYLKDFRDLLLILGRRSTWYSIEIQKMFLKNGGDIRTMFDETGHLVPEASIIQSTDMLPYIFSVVSDDDLSFLFHNSSEFVKNLITSTWTNRDHMLRVLKILFTIPVDEELWKAINNPSLDADMMDYRAAVVHRMVATLGKDTVIISIPEAVAYLEPKIQFISMNMTEEYVRFFPIMKIAPMLKNIIGRYGYIRFNTFSNRANISIAKAVGDAQFIINTLVQDKKYGYLCDMEGEDVEGIIDIIVGHME